MQDAFSEMKVEGKICWPPLIHFQKNLILLMKQCLPIGTGRLLEILLRPETVAMLPAKNMHKKSGLW